MQSLTAMFRRLKHAPTDVVGIDVAATGVKIVRMRKTEASASVSAVDCLPRVVQVGDGSGAKPSPLKLPFKFTAKHACLAWSGRGAVVKLLSFPGHLGADPSKQVMDNIGVEDPSQYRIGYTVVSERSARAESKVLAVAGPEREAAAVCVLLPAGIPAPYSLELSGLASLTSFLHGPGKEETEDGVAVIDFGASVSLFAVLRKRLLLLVRKFEFGSAGIVEKVQKTLGVDEETARGVMEEGSFDVSQAVNEVMEPFLKQFVISKDFIERRENCRISRLYACGGIARSRDWAGAVRAATNMDVHTWDPFEGLAMGPGAMPEHMKGQESRFCAAVGACLATFEGT